MKNILLLLVSVLLLSCENVELNDPALQGEIDNVFYKANDARGTLNEDETFLIQGVTTNQSLNLSVARLREGGFELGTTDDRNYATFEDENGNLYSTQNGGSGTIRITDECFDCGYVTGTFNFMAIRTGIDTIVVDKGIFYQVPFDNGLGEENPDVAGTFVATIDEVRFNPFIITAAEAGESIFITGTSSNISLNITVPNDVVMGQYDLPLTGFSASYSDGNNTENAISGNVIVFEHNTAERRIKATFSFETENRSITLGQFNVAY